MDDTKKLIVERTADIAAAFFASYATSPDAVGTVISAIGASLTALANGTSTEPEAELIPAVSIRASIKPDHLVCLEDGRKLKMLKRHLANLGMTPDQYRAKWGLPSTYPMVAPNYAELRRGLAIKIGLDRKPGQARGRRSKAA